MVFSRTSVGAGFIRLGPMLSNTYNLGWKAQLRCRVQLFHRERNNDLVYITITVILPNRNTYYVDTRKAYTISTLFDYQNGPHSIPPPRPFSLVRLQRAGCQVQKAPLLFTRKKVLHLS